MRLCVTEESERSSLAALPNSKGFALLSRRNLALLGPRLPTSGWRSIGCQASQARLPVIRESSASQPATLPGFGTPVAGISENYFPTLVVVGLELRRETDPSAEELTLPQPGLENRISFEVGIHLPEDHLTRVSPEKPLNSQVISRI